MKTLVALGAVATIAIGASLLLTSTSTSAHANATVFETGSVSGRVLWDGELPAPLQPLTIGAKESEGCCADGGAMDLTDRSRLVSKDGGIANVVLTVAVKGMEVKVGDNYHVDQDRCQFEPRVLVVPVGATVKYLNSDKVNHNVNVKATKNQAMNQNVAAGGHSEQKLEKAEVVPIKCDIHPWMSGYVFVTDDPVFGLTDANGAFKLEGLPPGTYKLSWWHEALGKGKSAEVTVEAGKDATLELKIGEKEKKGRR
jgi:plastocyanin